MEKHLRMIWGIVRYPIKRMLEIRYRQEENQELISECRARTWKKNHERMHWMSIVTDTAYTGSELYNNLYRGAPDPE